MYKNLTIASILGLLAIILGAFGSHLLKKTLSVDALYAFKIAVRYQIYHVIVLLFINIFNGFSLTQKNCMTWVFILGILFFSGSIYAISLLNISLKIIWFITPLGGLLFIIGWFLMAWNFIKKK